MPWALHTHILLNAPFCYCNCYELVVELASPILYVNHILIPCRASISGSGAHAYSCKVQNIADLGRI